MPLIRRVRFLTALLLLTPIFSKSQNCNLPAPVVQVTSTTACGLGLKWKSIPGADHYEVKYKVSGTSIWLDTINTGHDTTVTITGLQAQKKYVNKVTAWCATKAGGSCSINVKTTKCTPPTVISAIIQPDTSVIVTWDGCYTINNSIRYRISGTATWTTVNTGTNETATLTGLTYNATYEFEVKSCSSSAAANWSPISTFTLIVIPPPHYKPNVVVLLVDDGTYNVYLANGGPAFFTSPSINRIANEGANFKNNFVTLSVCGPSRCTLLTGLMSNHHGVNSNSKHLSDTIPTIGSILHSNGYYTSFLGKYPDISDVTPRSGWDYWMAFQANSGLHEDGNYNINGSSKEILGYNDYTLMDTALRIAQTNAHKKPFMIVVAYSGVHDPFLAPPGMDGIYDNAPVTVPENFYKYTKNYPSQLYDGTEYHDTATCVQDIKDQYEMQNGIDTTVQRLFAKLDELHLTDSTMILFTSDNGFFRGEHMLHGKSLAYEPSMRVPLFIRYPDWFATNTQVTSPLTLNIDIAPTILDAAGITNTYNMDGHSLHDYATGALDRDQFYYQSPAIGNVRAVRSKQYKYIWYNCDSTGTEEFFDLVADPDENTNHIHTQSYQSLIAEYRIKLDSLKKFWGDTINKIQMGTCHLANPVYDRVMQNEANDIATPLLLYPDPASDNVSIFWEAPSNQPQHLMIFNESAELVYDQMVNQGSEEHLLTIPVNTFANGLYEVVIDSGDHLVDKKLMVMK